MFSLSLIYQKGKDDITARGEEWHKLIDNHVKKLHRELNDLKKENEAVLEKKMRKFEEMMSKINDTIRKSTQLQKSKNITEMQKFKSGNEEQTINTEIAEYFIPAFHDCKIGENYMQAYFGYIKKNPEMVMSRFKKNSGTFLVRKVLEVPTVTTVIHAGNNNIFWTWPLPMTGKCGWQYKLN